MMLTVADTAFAIAAVRAEERALFDDPYAHLFRGADEGTARFLALPFFRDGIRLRTRFLDDVVAAEQAEQLVLLGAGFDARAHRLAHGARVFEVDLPEQLERKRSILAAAELPLSPVTYVGCDLRDFEAPLDAAGFRRDRSALVVWEGVTTYLGKPLTDRVLCTLATMASACVFDIGERFFDPETIDQHVIAAGFTSCESVGADQLWRRYLSGEPHPGASTFRMVIARR